MIDLIKIHDQEDDIQRLNLRSDVDLWKSEIQLIDRENKFYRKLLLSKSIATKISREDLDFLSGQLQVLTERNDYFLHKLQEFFIGLEGIRECDDLQCETFYLNSHQELKVEIENYFFENRDFKMLLLSTVEKGISHLI